MSEYQTVNDVLTRLVEEGYIDAIDDEPPFNTDDDTPVYLKAMLGLGGWIASFFFFFFVGGCLAVTIFQSSSDEIVGMAFIFMGLISVIAMSIDSRRDNVGAFLSQFRLAVHLAGHPLLLGGIVLLTGIDDVLPITLIAIIIQAVLLPAFRDATYRFLATVGIIVCLNILLYDLAIPGSLSVLIALLAFDVVIVWSGKLPAHIQIEYRDLIIPMGYGVVLGLFGTIAHELSYNLQWNSELLVLHNPFITSLMLLAITIWYEVKLLGDYDRPPTHRSTIILVGLTVIVTIPTLTTPGILAAILLILLGFRRKHSVLLICAFLFMAGFISYYYYSLQTTLLIKSFILMITGGLFLGAGLSVRRVLPDTFSEEA